MTRSPRPLNSSLFTKKSILTGMVQGLSILIFVSIVYIYALTSGRGDTFSRTITFATLVFANLLLIITNLSWSRNLFKTLISRNRALYWVLGMAISALLVILRSPAISSLFHFSPLTGSDLLLAFAAGLVSVVWFEDASSGNRLVIFLILQKFCGNIHKFNPLGHLKYGFIQLPVGTTYFGLTA
jgi:Ca2+-transporting ATPase